MKLQFDIAPNFIVSDLPASIAHYRDQLGFDLAVSDDGFVLCIGQDLGAKLQEDRI